MSFTNRNHHHHRVVRKSLSSASLEQNISERSTNSNRTRQQHLSRSSVISSSSSSSPSDDLHDHSKNKIRKQLLKFLLHCQKRITAVCRIQRIRFVTVVIIFLSYCTMMIYYSRSVLLANTANTYDIEQYHTY